MNDKLLLSKETIEFLKKHIPSAEPKNLIDCYSGLTIFEANYLNFGEFYILDRITGLPTHGYLIIDLESTDERKTG